MRAVMQPQLQETTLQRTTPIELSKNQETKMGNFLLTVAHTKLKCMLKLAKILIERKLYIL